MTEEQINNSKEILKNLIYKVRTSLENRSGIFELVFHYYTDSEVDDFKNYPVNTKEFYNSFNYERTKRQIRKKILSNRNNYWNLDESKIKILESFCINNPEDFDIIFKDYITNLWNCNLKEQEIEFKIKEQAIKEKDNAKLKDILKDKYDLYKEVVSLILNDIQEYPYKSDKIKILLELELDVDTIFLLLQTKEKWFSSRGYINKYYEERIEKIKQRKIVVYELNSIIKRVINQLKK